MHDGTTAYCAITADRSGFLGIPGFEHLGVGFNRTQIKSQATDGKTGSRSTGDLDKFPSVYLHNTSLPIVGLSCLTRCQSIAEPKVKY
jgi:hypothetical protein